MWQTTSRTFEVLARLQRNDFIASETLARELGVTTRTLRRDVARLRDLGYPVDTRRGADGGYSLEPGAVLPPIFLATEEALACALALGRRRDGTDENLTASALGKITGSLPNQVRWVLDAVATVTVDAPIDALTAIEAHPVDIALLGDLAKACMLSRRIEFTYTGRDDAPRARRAEPHSLVNTINRWYLIAFDLDAEDWRTFRVDRVTGAQVTLLPCRERELPGARVTDWITRKLSTGWQQVTATVRVHAPVTDVNKWMAPAWGVVEFESATTSIVRAGADSYDAIARWLLLMQADVDVIEPDELRDAFGRVAGQARRAAATP